MEHVNGPLLILAGAGSGKTRVITHRIAHLIEHEHISPDAILAVTFTNKAAAEMVERVERLAGGRTLAKPMISTFHSMCVRLLRRDIESLRVRSINAAGGAVLTGHTKDFAIYDEGDQQSIVKSVIKRMGIDDKQLTPRSVLSRISWAKNHMLDPEQVYLESADPRVQRVAQIYAEYKKELLKANALDFDDLLLEAVRMLKSNEEVRTRIQRRWRYIMVDEYQDTNRPQYELMKLLTGTQHNLCVVGDEDQSIYSWRGADINNILDFEQDFPGAKVIRLEQNYRSTQTILEAAGAVVANNAKRKGKRLWTARSGGAKIGFYEAPDGENEALFVADFIQKWLRKYADEGHEEPGRAAVLYRINAQSRLFEEALRRYNLRYNVVGGFSFYERAEIKDMIAYLKLIHNPHDFSALGRVINTPTRGIGKSTQEIIERLALETGASMWATITRAAEDKLVPNRAAIALTEFQKIIHEARRLMFGDAADAETGATTVEDGKTQHDASLQNQDDVAFDFGTPENAPEAVAAAIVEASVAPGAPLPEVLKLLLDRTGYMKQLEQEATPEALARMENLAELVNAARDAKERGESLTTFLDHAALVSDVDQYDATAAVTLMTLHAAKGLEFPLVCLAGLEEGLFPHSRALLDPDGIEEERRLCYVGITRAMDTLVISRARTRRRYGNDMPDFTQPSRFLEEIPPPLMEDMGDPTMGRYGARSGGYGNGSGYAQTDNFVSGEDHDFGNADLADKHYNYEDEDQSGGRMAQRPTAAKPSGGFTSKPVTSSYTGQTYNSAENIAQFFASRGRKVDLKAMGVPEVRPKRKGLKAGDRVKHPKWGEGTVHSREGSGDNAKVTVMFPRFGSKKLVEKYAQLEKM